MEETATTVGTNRLPVGTDVLVTGGTGTLGRLVVPKLVAAGCHVRTLGRGSPQDAATLLPVGVDHHVADLDRSDAKLDRALAGARTVVHLAGGQTGDDDKAQRLVGAAERHGVEHLLHVSVVGADEVPVQSFLDRMMFGYFEAKRRAEQTVLSSTLPHTVVRATQFHQLLWTVVTGMARMPVVPVPSGVAFQPIDAEAVAERVAGLAVGTPTGLAADVAGPDVISLEELVRGYLAAIGKRRPVVRVPLPGAAARAFRNGANLSEATPTATRTWSTFQAARLSTAGHDV